MSMSMPQTSPTWSPEMARRWDRPARANRSRTSGSRASLWARSSDAAMAAWTAYCFDRGYAHAEGCPPELDKDACVVREGYIVRPVPTPGGIIPDFVAPV
jgi:hypothetical protein